jgi:hypothetical protein
MPEFDTYVDVDVDEFFYECSSREKEELIDILVDGGYVQRVVPKGTNPQEKQPSIPELEWQELVNKLSSVRITIRQEDEDQIREILKKY